MVTLCMLLAVAADGEGVPDANGRIFYGDDATEGEFPFMVSQ